MRFLLLLFLNLTLVSCALTAPNGTKELMADMKLDRATRDETDKSLVGKPVFLKVRAYPRIQHGNIYGPHWILMQTKRESLNLDKLIQSLEE